MYTPLFCGDGYFLWTPKTSTIPVLALFLYARKSSFYVKNEFSDAYTRTRAFLTGDIHLVIALLTIVKDIPYAALQTAGSAI